ncbi:MAG TPA: SRPBCC family protein, partial [Nocardioidaceae bacterium]|nr:SRPBCC family protein [Nocardioidaceae bacterium]
QGEWIPLTRVERVDAADGVGGRFRAWTGIGPVGFWDTITITAWEKNPEGAARCEIMHTGRVVRGDAEFSVVPEGPDRCRVALWERLEIPGGPVGALLWRLVGRFVERGLGRVLRRMAVRAEAIAEGGIDV